MSAGAWGRMKLRCLGEASTKVTFKKRYEQREKLTHADV